MRQQAKLLLQRILELVCERAVVEPFHKQLRPLGRMLQKPCHKRVSNIDVFEEW